MRKRSVSVVDFSDEGAGFASAWGYVSRSARQVLVITPPRLPVTFEEISWLDAEHVAQRLEHIGIEVVHAAFEPREPVRRRHADASTGSPRHGVRGKVALLH